MRTLFLIAACVGCSLLFDVSNLTAGDILDGTWSVISAQESGVVAPAPSLAEASVTFDGKKMIAREKNSSQNEYTYSLDLTKTPHEITLRGVSGADKGQLQRGVFALKGDELQICVETKGGSRPSAFESRAGTNVALLKLRKRK